MDIRLDFAHGRVKLRADRGDHLGLCMGAIAEFPYLAPDLIVCLVFPVPWIEEDKGGLARPSKNVLVPQRAARRDDHISGDSLYIAQIGERYASWSENSQRRRKPPGEGYFQTVKSK